MLHIQVRCFHKKHGRVSKIFCPYTSQFKTNIFKYLRLKVIFLNVFFIALVDLHQIPFA